MTKDPDLKGTKPVKPSLRGYIHQESFFVALGASAMLIAKANTTLSMIASVIYSIGLLMMLGISALYHRITWQPKARAIMNKFDHSAIFVQIAGSFTPICLLALPTEQGLGLLKIIWITALIGIIQSGFWSRAPKWACSILYVIAGWMVLPYMQELRDSLGAFNLGLVTFGGIAYTVGAIFYALKRPNLAPGVFGYHELFHFLTVVGAVSHFIVIYKLIGIPA